MANDEVTAVFNVGTLAQPPIHLTMWQIRHRYSPWLRRQRRALAARGRVSARFGAMARRELRGAPVAPVMCLDETRRPNGPEVCLCGLPAVCYGAENGDEPCFMCHECGGIDHNDWGQTRAEIVEDMTAGVVYPSECGWLVLLPAAFKNEVPS